MERDMKFHIYNMEHEPLCWDDKALEFDDEAGEEILVKMEGDNVKISKVLEALDIVNEYINMLDEQGALSLDEARELEEADDIIRTFLLDKMEER